MSRVRKILYLNECDYLSAFHVASVLIFAQGDDLESVELVFLHSEPVAPDRRPSLCQPFASIAVFHVSTIACISRSD